MSTREAQDRRARFTEILSEFLQRYRRILLIIVIVALAGLIGLFAYFQIRDARAASSAEAVSALQSDYQDWLNAEEGESKQELGENILDQAGSIIGSYPRLYAAGRALYIRASFYWEQGELESAVEDFRRIANDFPESHLAPIALYNAASGLESTGDRSGAIELLNRLVQDYENTTSPEVPRALFSLGRMEEQEGNFEQAAAHYRKLEEQYGNSNWTNLARDRIIWLTTQGRIEAESDSS